MKSLQFSVVIPALNEEKFLPALLTSLAGQTAKNFEVIVVDGMSTDKTVAVAKRFATKLPKLTVVTANPRGLSRQRNLGASIATGDWIVFSDADNVFLPYFIERISTYAATKKTRFFTSWMRPDSEVTGDSIMSLFGNMVIEGSVSIKKPFSPGPLTIIDQKLFKKIGGYTEDIQFGEDYDFSKRVGDAGVTLSIIKETLYIWSMRRFRNEGSITTLRKFALATLYNLVTNKALTRMPGGYVMGGHLYNQLKTKTFKTKFSEFQSRVRKSVSDLFE